MFTEIFFLKKWGKIRKNPRRIQNICKRICLYRSFLIYSARASCDSDDIFWFSIPIFCDKRTRRPAANMSNPQGSSVHFFTISIKEWGEHMWHPLPSRLSFLRICNLIRMNICASFTFCREFVQNSFMNYEEYRCGLSTSAKSLVYPYRDFIDYFLKIIRAYPRITRARFENAPA